MDEQRPRRRRAPQDNVASSQENVATSNAVATRTTEERAAQHISQNPHTAHKKHKKKRSNPAFIAATIIEGLIIAILALSIALFVMNGWTENGIIGFANGIITTPTPIPTPTPTATPTPIPTATPTPQIEYIYITPQPTFTPTPTPIPTATPTPIVEYVYITPEPTSTLSSSHSSKSVSKTTQVITKDDLTQFFTYNGNVRFKSGLRALFTDAQASVLERIYTLYCKHLIAILEMDSPEKLDIGMIDLDNYQNIRAAIGELGEEEFSIIGKSEKNIEDMKLLINYAAELSLSIIDFDKWNGRENIQKQINSFYTIASDLFDVKETAELILPSKIGVIRNGITFGMSKQEVIDQEVAKKVSSDADHLIYDTSIYSYDCKLVYTFLNDQLEEINFLFEEHYSSANRYILAYNAIYDKICDKHGYQETEYRWIDDFYKNDESKYGMAVIKGDLVLVAEWDFDDADIRICLVGNNYEADILLTYKSKGKTL